MIKSITIAAVLMAASGIAMADGWGSPDPVVTKRPQPPVEVTVVPQTTVTDTPVSVSRVKSHGLFLGSVSVEQVVEQDVQEVNFFDARLSPLDHNTDWDQVGYLNYSPVTTGFSPVVGILFGEAKGFNLGLGYGLGNMVKPYVGLNTNHGDDYFTSDAEVGAFAGMQVALPLGLAVDLGVATPDADELGREADLHPFAGVGFRW